MSEDHARRRATRDEEVKRIATLPLEQYVRTIADGDLLETLDYQRRKWRSDQPRGPDEFRYRAKYYRHLLMHKFYHLLVREARRRGLSVNESLDPLAYRDTFWAIVVVHVLVAAAFYVLIVVLGP